MEEKRRFAEEQSAKGPNVERRSVTSNVNGNDDKSVKSRTSDQINEKKRKPGRKCSESMVPVYPG